MAEIGLLQLLHAPFRSAAVCTVPATDPLNIASLVTTETDRWNASGEPTLYLAGDIGTALAELGRHWEPAMSDVCLWKVELELSAAVDLRRREVRSAIRVPDDPRWFLDSQRCREVAERVRQGGSDGLIVPSAAFLDDLNRWNAVVFADGDPGLAQKISHATPGREHRFSAITSERRPPSDGNERGRARARPGDYRGG